MKLTEKQKNCPYCHGGNDHQPIYDSNRRSQKFSVNLKHENDKRHPHMLVISCKGDTSATGVDGEHWAIDQDIFERTYERVD